jgi:hypothetical protein
VLGSKHPGPDLLFGTAQAGCSEFGQVPVVDRVRVSYHACLVYIEAFPAVLTERFQQEVTGLLVWQVVNNHKGFVDKFGEDGERPGRSERIEAADPLHSLQIEATAENGDAPEEFPFFRPQKLVTPVHRHLQSPVAGKSRAYRRGQEGEAIIEVTSELAGREAANSGRCQLESKGNPIETSTDLRHSRQVGTGELKVRVCGPGTIHKQPHSVEGLYIHSFNGRGERKRRHLVYHLPGNTQSFSAGCQHAEVGICLEQLGDKVSHFTDQVLTVIEYQLKPTIRQIVLENGFGGSLRLPADAEGGGNSVGNLVGRGERGQIYEPHPVRKTVHQPWCYLDGEASLA